MTRKVTEKTWNTRRGRETRDFLEELEPGQLISNVSSSLTRTVRPRLRHMTTSHYFDVVLRETRLLSRKRARPRTDSSTARNQNRLTIIVEGMKCEKQCYRGWNGGVMQTIDRLIYNKRAENVCVIN